MVEATETKYNLTAKEAREIADYAPKQLTRVKKAIKECAEEGLVKLIWDMYNFSDKLADKIEQDLVDNGYVVKRHYHDDFGNLELQELEISW